ncbi:hypothetical protein CR513_30983, partial [Mucuna pruriens]
MSKNYCIMIFSLEDYYKLFKGLWMMRVRSKLGRMITVDKLTSIHLRCQCARFCVKVDISKRLVINSMTLCNFILTHKKYEISEDFVRNHEGEKLLVVVDGEEETTSNYRVNMTIVVWGNTLFFCNQGGSIQNVTKLREYFWIVDDF